MKARLERLLHLGGLALPEQAVVDEDALELRADGLVEEEGHYRAVHAAAQSADHPFLSHLGADALHFLVRECAHAEAERDSALLEEGLIQLLAARSVRHLGMELDGVEALLRIGHRAV